jgi:hypothetical protein
VNISSCDDVRSMTDFHRLALSRPKRLMIIAAEASQNRLVRPPGT